MSRITDFYKPYELSRSTLMMQQKLNNRSKDAMTQREITPEILPTRQEVKFLDIATDRPDVIADKHRKAVSIEIKLANMANNSIIDELGWKPSKIKSEVTQKMIDQYRAEMNQPTKIHDPTTGKDIVFKYKPSSIDLKPIVAAYTKPLEDYEIADIENEIVNVQMPLLQAAVEFLTVRAPQERMRMDEDYNQEMAAFTIGTTGTDTTVFETELSEALKARIKHAALNDLAIKLGITTFKVSTPTLAEKEGVLRKRISSLKGSALVDPTAKYEHNKAALEAAKQNALAQEKEVKFDIEQLQRQLDDNKTVEHQNNIYQVEADKENQARLKEAIKELELLNTGMAIPTQAPGESEEDYRLRLQNIGQEVLDDDEVEREAGILQAVKAKYNLRELLSDEGQIETIIKKLTPDEQTEMNTLFTGIKKKYLEVFGFNNTNMNVDKIVDFIKQMIPSISSSLLAPAKTVPDPTAPDPLAAASASPATGTRALKPAEAIVEYANRVGINTTRYKNLAEVIDAVELSGNEVPQDLLANLQPAKQIELARLGLIGYFDAVKDYQPGGVLNPLPRPPPPPKTPVMPGTTTGHGLGVHLNKLPKVIKLGHIHINPSNLYYENILSVRNPKNKPLRAYKDEHLSDYLTSLIIKLVEGGHITKHELQPLSEHEKMIYDNLIKRSKLHKMNDHSFEETALKMKQRLGVLEGELEAGNTNEKIKSEIHGILFKLAHAKVISQVDANKHWKSIMEIY